MLFNSYIFILLFLPLSIAGYYTLNYFKKYQLSKAYLILMSFWFYGYFNYKYVLIILTSIAVNYVLGRVLRKSEKAITGKSLLILGLLLNIGMLFYFKYFDFFITNVNSVFQTDYNLKHIVLPLGISFFTFQQLSYVIDCYKKTVPDYNILDYSLFVTFFPQLVAGPIVLHSEIVPQFADEGNKKIDYGNFSKGLYALSCGMGKKILLADTFGLFVSYGFGNMGLLNTTDLLFVMLGYTFQIYFDFSGYCDIATGIGYMFNIKIPMNFNSPYKATSILDFWKRWHITLTRFFTNYLYIPLGGNRGKVRKFVNVFIVFLVSGIWHGANWTFILWGILHGVFNIITRMCGKWTEKVPKILGWFITFCFVNATWLLFRSSSIGEAKQVLSRILAFNFGKINAGLLSIVESMAEFRFLTRISNDFVRTNVNLTIFMILFAASFAGVVFMKNTNEKLESLKLNNWTIVKMAVLMLWCITSLSGVTTFLYFNF